MFNVQKELGALAKARESIDIIKRLERSSRSRSIRGCADTNDYDYRKSSDFTADEKRVISEKESEGLNCNSNRSIISLIIALDVAYDNAVKKFKSECIDFSFSLAHFGVPFVFNDDNMNFKISFDGCEHNVTEIEGKNGNVKTVRLTTNIKTGKKTETTKIIL